MYRFQYVDGYAELLALDSFRIIDHAPTDAEIKLASENGMRLINWRNIISILRWKDGE